MKKIIIDINDSEQSLIKFLNKYLNKAPNSLLYKWIRTKKIKVNKKRSEPSLILNKGDVINFYIYDEELEKWQESTKNFKSKIDIDIVYENDDIIVFDKPQNVLVHAASKEDYGKNVVDFMIDTLIARKEYIPRLEKTFRPALINRIDRNTMGLVVGAKNRNALLKLNEQKDLIHKYYLAIVEGKIDKKIKIENKLVKDDNNFVKVDDEGKESITIINPIKYNDKYSLVEIELITGRTHQIRASLKDIGHPIIGDRRYGNLKSNLYKDQQLVAYKIEFNKKINLESIKGLVIESRYKQKIENLFNRLQEDI